MTKALLIFTFISVRNRNRHKSPRDSIRLAIFLYFTSYLYLVFCSLLHKYSIRSIFYVQYISSSLSRQKSYNLTYFGFPMCRLSIYDRSYHLGEASRCLRITPRLLVYIIYKLNLFSCSHLLAAATWIIFCCL